jgi:lysozyme family protein
MVKKFLIGLVMLVGAGVLHADAPSVSCQVALKTIFKNEGGYQCIRSDSGNWTGGKVGVGQLKGTNWGIAAASYPKVDIRNLTITTAAQYYQRDYWSPILIGGFKSQWLATMFLDTAVNCGTGTCAILIRRTINVLNGEEEDLPTDPTITQKEVDWVNNYTQTRWYEGAKDKSRRALFGAVFKEMRSRRYVAIVRHDPKKLQWLPTWLERTYE